MKLLFFVEGEPRPWPKKQYRIVYPSVGKPFVHTYPRDDGGKAAHWIETIIIAANNALLGDAPPGFREIWGKPKAIAVELTFKRTKPKSNRNEYPSTRPDLDNLAYLINNALEGVLYEDDSQIVRQTISKAWCEEDEEPGVYITIRTEGEE